MENDQLTTSFCGSPQYMAPQVVQRSGHSYEVDFYSLGALLHELVCGLPPFYSRDHDEMLERICNENLKISNTVSPNLKNLLTKLLIKDKQKRLNNFEEIKKHPWLKDIIWEKIIERKLQSPIKIDLYSTYIHPQFLEI